MVWKSSPVSNKPGGSPGKTVVCWILLLLFKEPHLTSASYWEEIALSQTDINHLRKSKMERGLDCSDLVVLAQNHTASAKSAWSCVCKCLTVTRTLLLQILSCRIYLVWKSGRRSYLLLALIAQEGSGKWPLSVFSSSCRMFYSLLRCLLLENDLAAQNCTGGKLCQTRWFNSSCIIAALCQDSCVCNFHFSLVLLFHFCWEQWQGKRRAFPLGQA